MSTVAVVLEQIRTQLLAEAEHDLAKAELYRNSRRQGERNSVQIYVERGTVAVEAAAMIEQVTGQAVPRRAMTETPPRRAMTATRLAV